MISWAEFPKAAIPLLLGWAVHRTSLHNSCILQPFQVTAFAFLSLNMIPGVYICVYMCVNMIPARCLLTASALHLGFSRLPMGAQLCRQEGSWKSSVQLLYTQLRSVLGVSRGLMVTQHFRAPLEDFSKAVWKCVRAHLAHPNTASVPPWRTVTGRAGQHPSCSWGRRHNMCL